MYESVSPKNSIVELFGVKTPKLVKSPETFNVDPLDNTKDAFSPINVLFELNDVDGGITEEFDSETQLLLFV
jgi:hypothetical protein